MIELIDINKKPLSQHAFGTVSDRGYTLNLSDKHFIGREHNKSLFTGANARYRIRDLKNSNPSDGNANIQKIK